MRKQIFATATMRRPRFKTQAEALAAYEANTGRSTKRSERQPAEADHDIIVKLALRIARATAYANDARMLAERRPAPWRESLQQEASSLDSDVCQLCVEMQRACRGETGPFPSDSWSHLNGG